MKGTKLINRFSEKILIWANGTYQAQKLRIFITLDPLKEFFKNFAQRRQVEANDLNNFPTTFCLGQMDFFGPKNSASSQLRIRCKNFFKRANRQMKVIIMVCTKKNQFRTNALFWAKKWHILITLNRLKSLWNERANRYMKVQQLFFEKKIYLG